MATGGSGTPPPSKTAGKMARKQLSKIREELTCCLCQELFTVPKILPCLHSFCEDCLEKSLNSKKSCETLQDTRDEPGRQNLSLVCPLCNDPGTPVPLDANGVKGLKTNFSFANMVEHLKIEDQIAGGGTGVERSTESSLEVEPRSSEPPSLESSTSSIQSQQKSLMCNTCAMDVASSFCKSCTKTLCSFCDQSHRRAIDTRAHQILSLGELESSESSSLVSSDQGNSFVQYNPWKCNIHVHEDVDIYCKTCKEVKCVRCIFADHRSHDCDFASKIAPEYKKEEVQLLKQVEAVELKFGGTILGVAERQAEVEESGKRMKREVISFHGKLAAELERQKEQLLRRVDDITKKKSKSLQEQIEELTRRKDALLEAAKFVRDIHDNCIDVEFLFLHAAIEKRLQTLCEQYGTLPQVQPRETNAIQFTKNEDFQQRLSDGSNAVGKVFADPHAKSFSIDELEKVHYIGHSSSFKVTARDIIGNRLFTHEGNIAVEVQPESGEPILCPVENNRDGTYTVPFHPQRSGRHTVMVFAEVAGKREPVTETPYYIDVARPHLQVVTTSRIVTRDDTSKTMKNPWGIVVTRDSKVVVSDVETNCLLIFDDRWNLESYVGKMGGGELEFRSPRGLALTPQNHIVVADKLNHRLQEVTLDRCFVRFFGKNKAGRAGNDDGYFDSPTEVAVNSQGTVLATDTKNNRVQCFQPDGQFLGVITNYGKPQRPFKEPYGIHIYNQPKISSEGHVEIVLITEREGCHVHQFQSVVGPGMVTHNYLGALGQKAGGSSQLKNPTGLAVDPKTGYVFIAEMSTHRITILSRNGEFVSSFGSKGKEHLQFHNPMNVAVVNATDIAVTDCANERIVVLRVLQD